jgi:hypothetical protein
LDIGAQLGGRAATAGANVGQSLLQGGINAARTQQGGQGFSPLGGLLQGLSKNQQFTQGVGNYFTPSPFATSAYSDSYQANIPVNNQSSGYY